MVLCLLIGFVLVVAMVSSVPIYTDGVLQRMLTKDLENYQEESGIYPGSYQVELNLFYGFDSKDDWVKGLNFFDKKIIDELSPKFNLPVVCNTHTFFAGNMVALPEVQREEKPIKRYFKLQGLSGFEDHIQIIHGRMYSTEVKDGVYEAVVTEKALKNLKLLLNEIYTVSSMTGDEKADKFRFKVVGVYNMKDPQDLFWFQGINEYESSLIIDFLLFSNNFVERAPPLSCR